MATLTVNVNDVILEKFRKSAAMRHGVRKGSLGKALSEAMLEWSSKKEAVEKFFRYLDSGFDMGKKMYSSRGDLYDRR